MVQIECEDVLQNARHEHQNAEDVEHGDQPVAVSLLTDQKDDDVVDGEA